jgi:hypothetical protein
MRYVMTPSLRRDQNLRLLHDRRAFLHDVVDPPGIAL